MLYVSRHGQTPWNVANKICGQIDVPLTETGEQQAKGLGQEIARAGLVFSRVISSPLERARRTAELALIEDAFTHRPELAVYAVKPEELIQEIEIDPRLIECDFGEMEGIGYKDESFLAYKRQFAFRYPGGESNFEVCHRVFGLLDELKAQHCANVEAGLPEEDILLVCHGGICRIIHTYFNNLSNDEFFEFSTPNAKLIAYQW